MEETTEDVANKIKHIKKKEIAKCYLLFESFLLKIKLKKPIKIGFPNLAGVVGLRRAASVKVFTEHF